MATNEVPKSDRVIGDASKLTLVEKRLIRNLMLQGQQVEIIKKDYL